MPLSPGILEVSDQFLLLGIDGDDRLPRPQGGLHLGVDMLELSIPVRVALPLESLAVGLEAVVKSVEQLTDHAPARGVTQAPEFLGQLADTLAGPPQRRLRVAASHRIDQSLQVALESRVGCHGLVAA